MKKTMVTAVLSLAVFSTGYSNVQADEALATQSGCTICHQVENKVVGPAYKEVAAKYKDQEDAIDQLTAKTISGGVGVWGQIPMPPKGGRVDVSDEDIKKIVAWIMSL